MKKPLIVIGGPTAAAKQAFRFGLQKESRRGDFCRFHADLPLYGHWDGEGDTRRSGWCAALSH